MSEDGKARRSKRIAGEEPQTVPVVQPRQSHSSPNDDVAPTVETKVVFDLFFLPKMIASAVAWIVAFWFFYSHPLEYYAQRKLPLVWRIEWDYAFGGAFAAFALGTMVATKVVYDINKKNN